MAWRFKGFDTPSHFNELARNREKHRTKQSQTKKKKQDKINILSYHPHQSEKNNCLGRTELARGRTLKSCEIFLKAVFLVECVECTFKVAYWMLLESLSSRRFWFTDGYRKSSFRPRIYCACPAVFEIKSRTWKWADCRLWCLPWRRFAKKTCKYRR